MEDTKLIKGLEKVTSDKKVLVAFPYAGGGASFYYRWQKTFEGICSVCPVQLPGREERFGEKFYTSVEKIADDVSEILSKTENPLILYGHSMGTKIVYEVEKRLEERGKTAELVIVSGCQNPMDKDRELISDLPDDVFVEKLISYNGISEELVANKDLLKIFLPILRADFIVSEGYKCESLNCLKAPVRAMGGYEDREAGEEAIKGWEQVNPGDFAFEMFEGSHFFIRDNENVFTTMKNWIVG